MLGERSIWSYFVYSIHYEAHVSHPIQKIKAMTMMRCITRVVYQDHLRATTKLSPPHTLGTTSSYRLIRLKKIKK